MDADTVDMLKEMGMDKIARLQQTSGQLPYQRGQQGGGGQHGGGGQRDHGGHGGGHGGGGRS